MAFALIWPVLILSQSIFSVLIGAAEMGAAWMRQL
jgi:hypothetical protein